MFFDILLRGTRIQDVLIKFQPPTLISDTSSAPKQIDMRSQILVYLPLGSKVCCRQRHVPLVSRQKSEGPISLVTSDLLLANNPPLVVFCGTTRGVICQKKNHFFSNDPGFGVFRNNPQLSKLFPEKKISRPSAENVEQQGGVICYQQV